MGREEKSLRRQFCLTLISTPDRSTNAQQYCLLIILSYSRESMKIIQWESNKNNLIDRLLSFQTIWTINDVTYGFPSYADDHPIQFQQFLPHLLALLPLLVLQNVQHLSCRHDYDETQQTTTWLNPLLCFFFFLAFFPIKKQCLNKTSISLFAFANKNIRPKNIDPSILQATLSSLTKQLPFQYKS